MVQTRSTVPKLIVTLGLFLLLVSGLRAAQSTAAPQAFVVQSQANAVSIIDTGTNSVVATIPVGTHPSQVAVSRDGARAYVLNTDSLSVSVIDAAAQAVIATVDIGERPSSLALASAGDRLYVLSESGVLRTIDTGKVVDSLDDAIVATLVVGAAGRIAVTPDGSRVYIAASSILVVDTATNEVVPSCAPQLPNAADTSYFATDVAISPDGSRAYFAVTSYSFGFGFFGFVVDGGIAVVDIASNAVTTIIPLYSQPTSISFNADGTRAFAAIGSIWANTGYGAAFLPGRWVASIDTATDTVTQFVDLGNGNTPRAVAAAPGGATAYAVVPATNLVAVIDGDTNTVQELLTVAGGPSSIAIAVGDAPAAPLPPPAPPDVVAVDDVVATAIDAGGLVTENVLANDRVGVLGAMGRVTLTSVSATHEAILLNPETGAVWAGGAVPAGSHALTYRICDTAHAEVCDDGVVTFAVRAIAKPEAAGDTGRLTRAGGTAIANVLANDSFGGNAPSLAVLTLTQISASDPGISLNVNTGAVTVARGTAAGEQSVVYRACEIARPDNCSEDATATVTVDPYAIVAVNDSTRASSKQATRAVINVLSNDSLGGVRANASTVSVTQVSLSPSNSLIRLNADGTVDVLGKSSGSSFTLTYQICEVGSPANCARARLTIELSGKN